MSILHRRKMVYKRQQSQPGEVKIPVWRELQKMDQDSLNALADSLGIEPQSSHMKTLSAINKAR